MRFSGQVFAFGGLLLAGSVIVQVSHAQAFGQQWRPAVAYPSAQTLRMGNFRSVANVPSFRPHAAMSPRRYSAPRSISRYQPSRQMYVMQPRSMSVYPGQLPQPYSHPAAGMWSAMPVRSNPMSRMGQLWQHPMPMFSRQIAAPPMQQPWLAERSPRGYRPRHDVPLAGNAIPSRFTATRYGRIAKTWRPAGYGAAMRAQTGLPRTVASYRPTMGVYIMQPRFDAQPAMAAMPSAAWRPQQNGYSVTATDRGFRPVAYGRVQQPDLVAHSHEKQQSRLAADELPGWVTTYQDPVDTQGCYWCNGS